MKKVLSILFAACVAVASVSLAQDLSTSDYVVIDLSGGKDAVSYPVSYMTSVPAGGWTNDLSYVTNKLVLRKIVETNGTFYFMGIFELTRGQWYCLTDSFDPNPNPQLPVTGVQHQHTDGSINETLKKSGLLFAFPTEAQWQYACCAGTTNLYHFDGGTDDPASLGNHAWYADSSVSAAQPVGQKLPNPWGLYDLYGNVAEFCIGNVTRGGHYGHPDSSCTSFKPWSGFEASDGRLGYRVCARLPLLAVNGGSGGGNWLKGTTNTVSWTPVAHHNFLYWQVDPQSVTNAQGLGEEFVATNATTKVVMPFADVTLTAITEPILYPLTVENGSGSGSYTNGQIVTITANPTNTLYFEFTKWSDAINVTVANPTSATTTVTMLGGAASVKANYDDKRYTLTVNFASGGGNYTNGQEVTIGETTYPPTAGHEFDHWEGDTATVADVNSAPTTFTMGVTNMTLTAIFRPKVVPQNTYLAFNLTDNTATYSDAPPVGGWTNDLYRTTQMVFRKIPAGSFTMGSPAGEPGRSNNEAQHAVMLTKDFYLGIFEVTQEQWKRVWGTTTTPSFFPGDTLPVERVYYSDIRGNNDGKNWPADNKVDDDSFMGRLRPKSPVVSAADLPTEAQWEYACRAGTTGEYAGPVDALAWYGANNTPNGTKVVGSKQPNPWGLYDMHGNVWEICLDWYKTDLGTVVRIDPLGSGGSESSLPLRVKRGGAYNDVATGLRSAARLNVIATNELAGGGSITNFSIPNGFRVALPQATASYALTVVNGVVNTGGVFAAGTMIGLSAAPAPAGQKFGAWQVNPTGTDLGAGFSPTSPQPLLTMPATALTVTVVYIPEGSSGLHRFVQNDPGAPTESWRFGGDTFTITAPAPAPGYRFNAWTVTPAGANLGAGFSTNAITTQVVMPAMDVMVTPTYVLNVPDAVVAATPMAGVAFELDAGAGMGAAKFSASGLPRGLRINSGTGIISGVPTKPGAYTVAVTAQYGDGSAVCYELMIVVEPLSPELQGTFTGYCYDDGTGQRHVRGLVTLRASKSGRITAKVSLQSMNLSFSAKSWNGMTVAGHVVVMERRQGERLELTADSTTGLVEGKLSGGRLGDEPLSIIVQRNAFQDRKDAEAQTVLAAYKGYYTVALPVDVCETDPMIDNRQRGSGYLTLTVRDRGIVRVAGKMADGTRVSQSTALLVDDHGAYVPLFVRLYGRRGVFAGLLQFGGGTQPADLRVDAEPAVGLEWIYPGSTMAGLADRFDAQLSATGAYYDTLTDLQAAYEGAFLQAEEVDWTMPLVAGRMPGSLILDPAVENPQSVKFRATRRSGLFSGSFRVLNETGRTAKFKYAGVLTRKGDLYIGDGAYVERRTVNGKKVKSSYRIWIDTPVAP